MPSVIPVFWSGFCKSSTLTPVVDTAIQSWYLSDEIQNNDAIRNGMEEAVGGVRKNKSGEGEMLYVFMIYGKGSGNKN